MTKMKRVLSLLLAVLMVAGLILVPVSADGESTGGKSYQGMEVVDAGGVTEGTSGLVMSKTLMPYEDGKHQLQLEVYTTGETVSSTIQVDAPTDIVLVLDQSGSMAWNIATTTYTAYIELTNSSLYSNKDNLWVKVGGEYKQATVTTKTTGDETYSALPNSTVNRTYSADWGSIGEITGGYYYYSENNNLYALVNGEYKAVKVEMSGNITNRSFTYSINEETIATSSGNDSVPNLGDYAPLYTKGEKLIYTYTYTDANGQTVTLATVEGQDGIYAATEGAGTDGELYSETSGTTPRLDALKTAVEKFADAVAEKAKGADGKLGTDDDINHRIAVVGFASDDSSYKNTELLTGVTITKGEYVNSTKPNTSSNYYFPTGYNMNGTQYTSLQKDATPYKSAFQDMNTTAGQKNVQEAIDALTAYGGTRTDHGLDMANQIFKNNSIAAGETRNRVVIVFTDGVPTSSGTKYDSDVASKAISNANIAKDTYGATVYTVGIFDDADENSAGSTGNNSSDADKGNYVCQQISSNNGVVPTGTAKKHYFAAKNTAALNNIFEQISQNIESSTTTTELGSETVVRDIVSSSFKLPEGADANSITIETYSCTGVDASGNYTWSKNSDAMGATASINADKTVDVTGFNFKANYVYATNSDNARGSKLVITIPIEDNGEGMGQVSTNGEASGVYKNSDATEAVALFKQPIVNFPYFTVTHIQSRVDTTGEKTGTVGQNYGENVGSYKYRVHGNDGFNLTNWVNKDKAGDQITAPDEKLDHGDYLYGGAFSAESCDTDSVQEFAEGENAMSFTPEAGAEYFIWEVPGRYLDPASYDVYHTNTLELLKHYMLVNVDRALYDEVGFTVDSDVFTEKYISGEDNPGLGGSMLYGQIEVNRYKAGYTEETETYDNIHLRDGKFKFELNTDGADEGFVGGYRLTAAMLDSLKDGTAFTFQPYWITLDGVRVTGHYSLTSEDTSAGRTKATWNPIKSTCTAVAAQPETQAMSVMAVFCIDDAEPVETVSLTVHDNGSVYTQSIDEELSYAGAEGKLFAGWFLDEDCTTPVDFESISESTDVYAKYVSDAYLQVKYNKLGLFRVSGVSLVSAVDEPANYAEVGILVNGEPVSVSQSQRYMLLFTAASLFDGASRSDTLLTAQLSLSGSGSLEVTPYWVTLDGTTVYGQSRTLTYTARSIQG